MRIQTLFRVFYYVRRALDIRRRFPHPLPGHPPFHPFVCVYSGPHLPVRLLRPLDCPLLPTGWAVRVPVTSFCLTVINELFVCTGIPRTHRTRTWAPSRGFQRVEMSALDVSEHDG